MVRAALQGVMKITLPAFRYSCTCGRVLFYNKGIPAAMGRWAQGKPARTAGQTKGGSE